MQPQPLHINASISVAWIDFKVPAGFPSPAMDYIQNRIDLNDVLIQHPLSTFIFEVEGDSMIDAFIPPAARIIVDRSLEPKNGDIVLAVLEGAYTVKFLKKNTHKCWLIPANKKYKDIEITAEMNMQVWGVVTNVITNTNTLKRCML